MHIEEFRDYCLSKPGVEETFPFGPETLVFKVMGKMFALTGLENIEFKVNLKCDPDRAVELRDMHHEITPGWHMSKKHWNTVEFETGLEHEFLLELINHSYDMVVEGLPNKLKEELANIS